MSNYNPRTLLFNEKYLDQISIEKIEQVYRDRIKDASDFTFFIVGNIDAETVKPLVEKYIGSLKSENRKETWRDNHVRGPKGKTVKEIELELTTPKSTVITNFLFSAINASFFPSRLSADVPEKIMGMLFILSVFYHI